MSREGPFSSLHPAPSCSQTKEPTVVRKPASEWFWQSGDLLQWWCNSEKEWRPVSRMNSMDIVRFSEGLMARDSENHRVLRERHLHEGTVFGGREDEKWKVYVLFFGGLANDEGFIFDSEAKALAFVEAARDSLVVVKATHQKIT